MDKKFKALVAGRNKALIGDILANMSDELDIFTTTLNTTDLQNHLTFLKPDFFIFCANIESDGDISTVADLRDYLNDQKISMIITGPKDDCDKITGLMSFAADLTIPKPPSNDLIFQKISELIIIKDTYALTREKKHILIIDDDPMMLKIIKDHLHESYNIATAVSGKVALKFLETKTTDLILLDYEMPEMNGPEVLEALRNKKSTANIPVVFLTGTKDRAKVQNALMLKPQGYLLKPIEKDKLTDMIHNLLGA